MLLICNYGFALPSESPPMVNKDRAKEFLKLIIKGQIEEAYEKFVNMNGKHHNIHFKAGFEALKTAMKENHNAYPNKKFEIILSVEEDDIVALLTKVGIGHNIYSISHFFKFKDGKIIEMWDNAQELTKNIKNKDGAF